MRKQRNKIKLADRAKMQARFDMKCEEFNDKSLEELRELFRNTKMSSTDRQALVKTVDMKLSAQMAETLKDIKDDNIDAE